MRNPVHSLSFPDHLAIPPNAPSVAPLPNNDLSILKHISDHNGVFTRGTVKGVVSDTCSCLVEQLLNGYKVQFGELGIFSISITCEPAATLKDFSSDNIKAVNILFNPGIDFENLRSKAEFNLVTSRAIQAASLKAVKENKDTVDLAALKKGDSESPDEI